jgi:hypothetical protein
MWVNEEKIDHHCPRGPKGEKRLADVIGNTVHVMRIATGEIEDNPAPRFISQFLAACYRERPAPLGEG